MVRLYGGVTAIIGVIHIVYNVLWLPRVKEPFPVPQWLIFFELAWAFVSFGVVARRTRGSALPLAVSYVVYSAFALTYSYWLGSTYGGVRDEMIPTWWKLLALAVGVWFTGVGTGIAIERSETR